MVEEALLVTIAGTRCAVPMDRVTEVRVHTGATRIPGAPAWVHGIVHRSGAPVEVFDAALRTGLGALQQHERNCVIFLDAQSNGVGAALLVDSVDGITPRVTRPAATSHPFFSTEIAGGDGPVPLLDVERVLEVSS